MRTGNRSQVIELFSFQNLKIDFNPFLFQITETSIPIFNNCINLVGFIFTDLLIIYSMMNQII